MSTTLRLVEQLISCPSITPEDAGCLDILEKRLAPLGFVCERLDSGPENFRVANLWAKRTAHPDAKTLVFAGHTDVVPTGPVAQWQSPPFTPTHREGKLYGRGAADMKSSIAAFIVALESWLKKNPAPHLNVALLLTSDEEGPAVDGTVAMCTRLQERGEKLDYCIVGEPTSVERTGDMIKNGRRGTMSGKLTVQGIQGHIAYPHLSKNPIHLVAPALAELVRTAWDQGNDHFPPTSWQISNIHGGTGASNVIPGEMVIHFNFRFCTESSPENLQQRFSEVLQRNGLRPTTDYVLEWVIGGLPFLTPQGDLVRSAQEVIQQVTGIATQLSTTGGTSDGRFIAKICNEVIEIGPPNASIHKIDECIDVKDIDPLKDIYLGILEKIATL